MTTHDNHNPDLTSATWRKATYSNGNGGNCVEIAHLHNGARAVRDSKNPTGPALRLTATQWTAFTTSLRSGKFT
ncbi:MAG TPA: DUF397 domain-containing protein [Pseudonocardiaceae bacterium]|nr:DUF397 domain-containing protein [Pseudonocardiaceae bacterium]